MTYYIASLAEGQYNLLATYETYSEADMEHEDWCNKYPNAWIEIISQADYTYSKGDDDHADE